LKKKER